MANKRMFSVDVVCTDKFLEMPTSTQALYFQLGMKADDDGFVSAPRQITRMTNCSDDDLRLLISKGYLIPFDSGVVVIKDWRINNYLRKDRYTETRYTEEKQSLQIVSDAYVLQVGIPSDNQMPTNRYTQVRLGKDSIDKNSINTICPELEEPAQDQSGILLPLVDKTDYDVPLSKIEKWSQAYPAVDVKQELQKMAAWLLSNPKRRKTRKGIDRFINTWLSKEQDKGGIYRNRQGQQDIKQTRFSNFDQRDCDYDELEKQLLNQ